jgi:hypothetical protein
MQKKSRTKRTEERLKIRQPPFKVSASKISGLSLRNPQNIFFNKRNSFLKHFTPKNPKLKKKGR